MALIALTVEVPEDLLAWLRGVADEEAGGDVAPVLSEMLSHVRELDTPSVADGWMAVPPGTAH